MPAIAQMLGALVILSTLISWAFGALAGADSVTEGQQVPNSAVATGTFTANTPFASGQQIDVEVPANSVFTGQPGIKILECADPGGSEANDPTEPSDCDGNTIQGPTVIANSDGSVDYTGYTIYALPDSPNLGEPSSNTPVCNLSNACVLYIGQDQTDFTQPHVFSQPFWVSPNATDDGTPAGDGSQPAAPTAPDPSTSTVTTSSGTACPSGLSPAPSSCAVADGSDAVTVTVTLLDSSSVPVAGKTVSLSGSSGTSATIAAASSGSNVSDSNGQALFSVTDADVESVILTATDTTDSITLAATPQIDFVMPVVSATNSTVAANPAAVPADGTTASTITVTLRDQAASSQPVAGKSVTLSAGGGSSKITPTTAVTTDSSGVATFTVTDTANEVVTYTATDQTDSVTLSQTASVTFGTITASGSSSTVAAGAVAPLGSVGEDVVATLLTSGGGPVAGKTVTLSMSPTSSTASILDPSSGSPTTTETTGSNGEATFKVTDTAAETITFSATDTTDSVPISQTAPVQFEAPAASASESTVACNPCTAPADGSTAASVTVKIVDQFGNPVAGDTLSPQLTDPSGNARAASQNPGSQPITDSNGVVAFDVVDTSAEQVTFGVVDSSASSSGLTIAQTVQITFTSGEPSPTISTIGANPTTVPADGKTASTITVTLLDDDKNPVSGKTVTLTASGGSSTINPSTGATSNSSGQAVFTVTDTANEQVTYTANDTTDSPNVTLEATVIVTFGTPPPAVPAIADSVLTSSAATAPANGSSAVTILVLLADSNGDPVNGKTVALNPSGGTSVISPATTATTDQNGEAKFTVTDTQAEAVTYTATDTTDNLPITGQSVTVTFTPSSSSSGSSGSSSGTTATTTPGTSTSGGSGTTGSGGSGGGASTEADDTGSGTGGSTSDTGSSSDDSGSGSQLAYTGVPKALPWLIGLGFLLLVAGTLGRRFSLKRP